MLQYNIHIFSKFYLYTLKYLDFLVKLTNQVSK